MHSSTCYISNKEAARRGNVSHGTEGGRQYKSKAAQCNSPIQQNDRVWRLDQDFVVHNSNLFPYALPFFRYAMSNIRDLISNLDHINKMQTK